MTVLVNPHHKIPELGVIVSTVLIGGTHSEKLTVIMSDKSGRRQDVNFRLRMNVVPEIVHVTTEHSFGFKAPEQIQQPAATGLIDVVVRAGFVGIRDIGRIVNEQKRAPIHA